MQAQATGGVLLFNASKQALNPGADFGPYGIPKAAVVALAKQYAIDYGSAGIRANVVNADRIRSGLLTGAMIADRSTARGVTQTQYMSGNSWSASAGHRRGPGFRDIGARRTHHGGNFDSRRRQYCRSRALKVSASFQENGVKDWVIGVIGGSGLYEIESLQDRRTFIF